MLVRDEIYFPSEYLFRMEEILHYFHSNS